MLNQNKLEKTLSLDNCCP